jgi:hypothetical protein
MPRTKREINHHPNPLKLMFVNELAAVVGLNAKAIREAMHAPVGGLEYILVGKGSMKTPKSNLFYFQRWLERNEQQAQITKRTEEVIASMRDRRPVKQVHESR